MTGTQEGNIPRTNLAEECIELRELQEGGGSSLVVLPCLLSKAEEGEEQKGADDRKPSIGFIPEDSELALPPEKGRILIDAPKVLVGISPADPRLRRRVLDVDDDGDDGEGSGEGNFGHGECHKAEVSSDGERLVRAQVVVKLDLSPSEGEQS